MARPSRSRQHDAQATSATVRPRCRCGGLCRLSAALDAGGSPYVLPKLRSEDGTSEHVIAEHLSRAATGAGSARWRSPRSQAACRCHRWWPRWRLRSRHPGQGRHRGFPHRAQARQLQGGPPSPPPLPGGIRVRVNSSVPRLHTLLLSADWESFEWLSQPLAARLRPKTWRRAPEGGCCFRCSRAEAPSRSAWWTSSTCPRRSSTARSPR